jgi:hypothetical protein
MKPTKKIRQLVAIVGKAVMAAEIVKLPRLSIRLERIRR